MDAAQLILLLGLSLAAAGVALALQRRRPEPPSAPSYKAPAQVDRDDFVGPDAPVLIAVFTSATCAACSGVWNQARVHASPELAIQNIEVSADSSLHKRYKIDGVPTTLVVDADGVVTGSFFGPIADGELERALSL